MDNLNVRDYENLEALTGALEQIVSGDQPFQRVLMALRDNTRPPLLSEKLSDKERACTGRTGLATAEPSGP